MYNIGKKWHNKFKNAQKNVKKCNKMENKNNIFFNSSIWNKLFAWKASVFHVQKI